MLKVERSKANVTDTREDGRKAGGDSSGNEGNPFRASTDLCSSSSSSLDIIISRWWERAFPGTYFKELFTFDSMLSAAAAKKLQSEIQFRSGERNKETANLLGILGYFHLRLRGDWIVLSFQCI